MARFNTKERQDAIDRFYEFHGNHTHEVTIEIDTTAMMLLWRRHYQGRVDITKYFPDFGANKLKLKTKAP